MAAAWHGLPVRLDRAPQRGAAFALASASRRAWTRHIGSRSTGSLLIFTPPPARRPPFPWPCSFPCRPRPPLARLKIIRRTRAAVTRRDPHTCCELDVITRPGFLAGIHHRCLFSIHCRGSPL